jgi:predicted dehydrogenase
MNGSAAGPNGVGGGESGVTRERLSGIAVIGLGYWGPNWVRNLQTSGLCERIVACDFNPARRRHIENLYPAVETCARIEPVVADPTIKAVVIATPVHTHWQLARRCLEAGKSVLVEKPLALSGKQSAELIEMAAARALVLMVGHTFQYSASVGKLCEIVDSGELGEIFYISAIRTNLGLIQQDINVVWDLAPHDISIILAILGRAPESVNCQGRSHYNPGIEDVALLTLNFSGNVIAFVHVSWLDPNKIRRITVVGSRKMLIYDDVAYQEPIRIYDKGVNVLPYYDTFSEFRFSYRYGDVLAPRVVETEPLKVETEHFIDCVLNRRQPRSDGLNGLRVVSVMEAADASMHRDGALMPVKYAVKPDVSG